jgi:uroporphyrinogen III methyltransferase/synthase
VAAFPPGDLERLERGELSWIGLGSPSIVESLMQLCTPAARAHLGRQTRLVSISPVTSARARELGLEIAAQATRYTWDGIIDAVIQAERVS